MYPIKILTFYFLETHRNIALIYSQISQLQVFLLKYDMHISSSFACYIICPSHLSRFHRPNNIWRSAEVIHDTYLFAVAEGAFLQYYITDRCR